MNRLRSFALSLALLALALPSMATTYSRILTVNLGTSRTGIAANLTYKVIDSSGSTLIAATNTGVAESPAGSGCYHVSATWDDSWIIAEVQWIDATDSLYATAPVNPAPLTAVNLTTITGTNTQATNAASSAATAATQSTTAATNTGAAAIASATQTGLIAQGLTSTRASYLDTLNGLVTAIWANATRTLSAFAFTPVAASVTGDIGGKVLGGGSGTITGDGARAASVTTGVAVASVATGVIAHDVWDALTSEYVVPNSLGAKLGGLSSGGSVTVAGYATGQDPATLIKADTTLAKTFSRSKGLYTYNATTKVVTLLYDDGSPVSGGTVTLTTNSSGVVLSRL